MKVVWKAQEKEEDEGDDGMMASENGPATGSKTRQSGRQQQEIGRLG